MMETSRRVSAVHVHVMEDVVAKVRNEFAASGVGEEVLSALQAIWVEKMAQCGAITGMVRRPVPPPAAAVHDLNVPYEGPYETPTVEMLFPPTPHYTPRQTPHYTPWQTPLPGTVQTPLGTVNNSRNDIEMIAGRTGPYTQPPSPWMNRRPLGVNVNAGNEAARARQPMTQDFFMGSSEKRKPNEYSSQLTSGGYIPQRDGSGDMMIEFPLPEAIANANASDSLLTRASLGSDITATVFTKEQRSNTLLVQQDGVNDEYDHFYHYQGVSSEGHHAPAHYVKNETLYGDEPPLNEDDDVEDDLEDEQGNAEPNTHLVLAQFDKVTRTKSKWKCTLKSGIMHYHNRDVLFNTATGEFEF